MTDTGRIVSASRNLSKNIPIAQYRHWTYERAWRPVG